jgi:RNA polymerase sigma factor (sigma-70 family)
VVAARAGQNDAWERLVARFQPTLEAVARRHRLTPADVEDVVQRTWEKCYQHLADLRDAEALPGWLTTTCRREALAVIRGQQRCIPVPDDSMLALASVRPDHRGTGGDPVDTVVEREQMAALCQAVAGLPERQRLLVATLMQSTERKPVYGELAAALAMPIGSIGPTRLRAITTLRRELRQVA